MISSRTIPWLLEQVARTGSRELFTLCVIAVAVCIAYGSAALFGVSFALGGRCRVDHRLRHRARLLGEHAGTDA